MTITHYFGCIVVLPVAVAVEYFFEEIQTNEETNGQDSELSSKDVVA